MKEVIFPPKINKSAKIAIITPAGSVQQGQLDKTLEYLEKNNLNPVLGKNVYAQFENGYSYGGTFQQRLEDLQWALDGDFGAIWTSRGGYGCVQLLSAIKLNKFKKKPKYLIGYSDVTVLQSFLLNKGFASIHGQSIKTSSFGVEENSYQKIVEILKGKKPEYNLNSHSLNKKGKAEGQLVGGNLAMICSVSGSRYAFDFKDKILFIEEIGENYYALDRMLMNLEVNGIFKQIKGLIVGGMINMGDEKKNPEYENSFDSKAYQLVAEKVEKYNFPVAFGMPNGHIYKNYPLIIGGNLSLNVENKVKIKFQ